MSLSEFLAELNACGARLWLEQGALRYSAPAPGLSHEQRSKLAAAKPEICELLGRASVTGVLAPSAAPHARPETMPLTLEQQRIWRSELMNPADAAFNICGQAELSGPLNVPALQQALREIVRRHDILRSKIVGPDDRCAFTVVPDCSVALTFVDLQAIADADGVIARMRAAEGRRLFDLRRGPLLRASLVRRAGRRHALILTVHHLVFDHWSLQVLTRELHLLYAAYCRGQISPLQELRVQVSQYAFAELERLSSAGFDSGLAFWRRQLRGLAPTEFPVHPRMFRAADRCAEWVQEDLTGRTLMQLRAVARSREMGLPAVLVTAWFAILRRYIDQDDLAVGTTIVQRTHPDFEPLIGLLINTVAVRCDLAHDPALGELLKRMQKSWNDSVAHADVPFQLVLDSLRFRHPGPPFNVGVEIRLAATEAIESDAGLAITPVQSHFVAPVRDLTLFLEEAADRLTVRLEYRRDVFAAETIRQLSRRFAGLMRVFSQCLSVPLSALPIEDEADSAFSMSAASQVEGGAVPTLIESVLRQARRTPDAIAVEAISREGRSTAVTYAQLARSVTELTRGLRARIQAEALIAVHFRDPVRCRLAALGVMRAGGAFLVVDPRTAKEQIADVRSFAPVAAILTERSCAGGIEGDLPVWVWDDLCSPPAEDCGNGVRALHPRGLACVQLLSGPNPEAVASEHQSLALSMQSLRSRVGKDDFARMLSTARWGSAPSLFEFFMPLICGGTAVLIEDGLQQSAAIQAVNPTALHATPGELDALLQAATLPASLRAVYASGGVLHGDTLKLLFGRSAIGRVVSCYGRTEAGSFQSCAVVSRPGGAAAAFGESAREPPEHECGRDTQRPAAPAAAFNATEAAYPREKLVHELFEEQAERTPDSVAVLCDEQSLTYSHLNRKANQLARYLREHGVGPEQLVGICMERSVEMVIGLLGILKAGGAYVPLDPTYPAARLADMLHDSAPRLVLIQQRHRTRLAGVTCNTLALDEQWFEIERRDGGNLHTPSRSNQLAYVIYTSGSTGEPKGSMNEHRAVVNRLQWMQDRYRLDASDRVLQKTPVSFDVSVWEFFWPLMTGACLIMARPEGHKDPAYLRQTIEQAGVTRLHFVPSMLRMFLEQLPVGACPSVRQMVCSGEELPPTLQNRCLRQMPHARLSNLYGPTETAVDVTSWECLLDERGARVPIGRPISNLRIYVLDRHAQPVPIGVAGEIYIGGVGVGRGYLNRPQLTAERFVHDPFGNDPRARMYRTGDLGRWRADGAIEYLGRNDDQVKVRGYRVELAEIASQLLRHEQVSEAVVVAREDEPGAKRLVAYVTGSSAKAPSIHELRLHLQGKLPGYMLPAAYVVLDRLPLTPNGKVDKRNLPPPGILPRPCDPDAIPSIASIGRPLDGIGIPVLRGGLELAPIGLAGQMAIATPLLARGYVGRPALTAARFQPDPTAPGARRFLTGERACIGRDGSLYWLGRLGDVTSLHGRYIDLLEVEAVLRTHTRVRAAAASIVTDGSGRQALVAHVVAADERFDVEADLRDHVLAALPPYMVPESIACVPTLPFRDGSLDREALPAVTRRTRAARTQTERTLVSIWEQVLRTTPVNPERSFFDLGGDSLNLLAAARLTSERFGREVTATDMLRHASIRSLARDLDSHGEPRSGDARSVQQRAGARLQALQAQAARAREASA